MVECELRECGLCRERQGMGIVGIAVLKGECMERLTKRIPNPKGENIVAYTMGAYEDTTAGEMTGNDIRTVLRALANYEDLEEQGLLLKLPVSIGDTVYVLCECGMIPQQLDGTLYSSDGSPGTATGYYCPYEDDCPHDCEECEDLFDCDKFKQKSAVFEDTVKSITLEDGAIYISTENCNIYSPLGYAVFLTKAEAEEELKKMESEE